jgi:hypothetical protein
MLRSPAQGGLQEVRPRVVLAGDCGAFHLADLIAFLGQSRWSGVLRVTAPTGERSLLLKDGDVRSAASDSSTDRIGEVMVRMGYVARAALEKVLAEAPPSRIGKALVERGLIKAHDLYKCLNEQISEIFHGIMLSKEGAFALIDQEIDEKALTHNLSMSMNGLLMDSIRKIDELAQFHHDDEAYARGLADAIARFKDSPAYLRIDDRPVVYLYQVAANPGLTPASFAVVRRQVEDRAGPVFYEIIQRAGDPGFGYGNFRALFESIERAQRNEKPRTV